MSSKVVHSLFEFKEQDLATKMKGQRDALKFVHEKVASITRHMETERNPREQESRRALQAAMMNQEQLQQEVHKLLSGNAEVHKTLVERDQLQQEIQKQCEKNSKEWTERNLLEKVLEENQKTLLRERNLKEEYVKREKEVRAEIEMLKNYRHNEFLKDKLQLEVQKLTELLSQERDNYQKENAQRLQLESDFKKTQEELHVQKNLNQEFIVKENETRTELEKLRNNSDGQALTMTFQVRETNMEDQNLRQKEVEELATAYLDRGKFLVEQKALRENYACLKEEMEMTASCQEVTSKCEEMECLGQVLEQRLKMEVKMNEENVKNGLALIQTIRDDQEAFWRKMEEEMEAVHMEATMREESLREEVEELKAQLHQKEEFQEPPLTHFEVNFHVEFLPRSLTPEILEEDMECRPQLVKVQMTRKNNSHLVRTQTPDMKIEERNIPPDPEDPLLHLPVATVTPNNMQMRKEELQHLDQDLRKTPDVMQISDEILSGQEDSMDEETKQPKSEEHDSKEEETAQQVHSSRGVVDKHMVGQQQQPEEVQQNIVEEATSCQDSLGLRENSEEKMSQQESTESEELEFVILEESMAGEEALLSDEGLKETSEDQLTEDILRLDMVEVREENPQKMSEDTVTDQEDISLRDKVELNHQPIESEEVQQKTSEGVSACDSLLEEEESKLEHNSEKTVSCQEDLLARLDLDKLQKQVAEERPQKILKEQMTAQTFFPVSEEPEFGPHEPEQPKLKLETTTGLWTGQEDFQLSGKAQEVKHHASEEHLKHQYVVLEEAVASHEDSNLRLDMEEPGVQKETQESELSEKPVICPEDASLRQEPEEHHLNISKEIPAHREDVYLRNAVKEHNYQQNQKPEEIPEEILSDLDDLLLRENVEDLKDQEEQEKLKYESSEQKVLNLMKEEELKVHPQTQELGEPQRIVSEKVEAGRDDVREEVEDQKQKPEANNLCYNLSDVMVTAEEDLMEEVKDQNTPVEFEQEEPKISEEMLPGQVDAILTENVVKITPHIDVPEEHQQSLVEMVGCQDKPDLKAQAQSEDLLEGMLPDENSEVQENCSDELSVQNIQMGSSEGVDSNPQPMKPQTFLKKAHQYMKLKTPAKCMKQKNISPEWSSLPSSSPQRSLSENKRVPRGEVRMREDLNPELSSAQADKTEATEEDLSNDEASLQEAEELTAELQEAAEPHREMPTTMNVWKKTCQFLNLKTLGKKKRPVDHSPTHSFPATSNSSSTENVTREKESRRNLDMEQEPTECRLDNEIQTAEEEAAQDVVGQQPECDQVRHSEETCHHLPDVESPKAQIFLEKNLHQLEMTQRKSLTSKNWNILSEFSLASLLSPVSLENHKRYEIEVKINKEEVRPALKPRSEQEEEDKEDSSGRAEGEQEDSEELQNLSIQVKFPDPHDQELLDEVAQNRLKVLNLQMVCKGPLNILQTKAFISVCPSLACSPDI